VAGFIRIVFVSSEENKSDMFTRNLSSELYNQNKGSYSIRRGELLMIMNAEGRVLEGELMESNSSVDLGAKLVIKIIEIV
jgi:hypothetical protein